jgi:predicted amidohydrolase
MIVNVALGQMDLALGAPERNLATVEDMARTAAERGADLLLVPELWSTGYVLERAAELASPLDTGINATVGQVAQRHGIALFGSTLTRLPQGIGNTATLFDRSGKRLGVYSKIHLFGLMDEPRYLIPGTTPTLVETPWGKAGLAICYDLRFPELFRAYALAGADLILLVAEWPLPRLLHWQTLLRARAIENQCFVVACNRVGTSGITTFFGHSTVIDPWGEILFEADDTAGLHVVTLDLDRLVEARRRLPVLRDRRPDCYSLD